MLTTLQHARLRVPNVANAADAYLNRNGQDMPLPMARDGRLNDIKEVLHNEYSFEFS